VLRFSGSRFQDVVLGSEFWVLGSGVLKF